ncbi:DUF3822 family protein [Polaribacter sp.]|uniref:DUF3822 family protein n=1 Tax=Polaribacter sp. TaxID=1920175 RepID=UPI003F6B760B
MKIRNSNISLNNSKENKLSIQFNLDGFSFCIHNPNTNEDVYFSEYSFVETLKTPEELLEKIKGIFKEDTILQKDFNEVQVIHQNNLNTLVPSSFFNENHLKTYLSTNIKTLATDFITFDEIKTLSTHNVYIPYVNINNYFFQHFGEFEYKHHTTAFIEKIIKLNIAKEQTMFVNVSKNSLDILVIENNKILLANSFSYNSKEDFIYYILFVAEQLNLNTNMFSLYFTGIITLESDIYKIAFNFIRNIYFLESNNPIFNHLNIDKHHNYILLGS